MNNIANQVVASSKMRECENCGAEFDPKRHWQRYCSARCRSRAWDATHPRMALVPEGSTGAPRPAGPS